MSKELREAKKLLKEHGFLFSKNGANHDIYRHEATRAMITLKRHRNFNKSDLDNLKREVMAILKGKGGE